MFDGLLQYKLSGERICYLEKPPTSYKDSVKLIAQNYFQVRDVADDGDYWQNYPHYIFLPVAASKDSKIPLLIVDTLSFKATILGIHKESTWYCVAPTLKKEYNLTQYNMKLIWIPEVALEPYNGVSPETIRLKKESENLKDVFAKWKTRRMKKQT